MILSENRYPLFGIMLYGGSAPAPTAVHVDGIRVHEAARVGAHEQHELADFLRLPEALHRDVVEKSLQQFRRGLRRGLEGCLDRAARNRQTTDAEMRELAR